MDLQDRIDAFLGGQPHAVVGASTDRSKYGNKVLRAYLQADRQVYAVHPTANEIEGLPVYPALASIPGIVHGISIITPPPITEKIVAEAGALNIKNLWIQPGAENEQAIALAHSYQMNLIAGGDCLLVAIGFRDI